MTLAVRVSPKGSQSSCPQVRSGQLEDHKAGKIPSTPVTPENPTPQTEPRVYWARRNTHMQQTCKADRDSEIKTSSLLWGLEILKSLKDFSSPNSGLVSLKDRIVDRTTTVPITWPRSGLELVDWLLSQLRRVRKKSVTLEIDHFPT